MSNQFNTRRIKPMRTKDDLNKRDLLNTSGVKILARKMVRLVDTKADGAYHQTKVAIADGTQPTTPLWVAWHDVDDGDLVISSENYLLTFDTSAGAVGDSVYLSATVAGDITLTATNEQVGWVTSVGATGLVWISPQARTATTATTSGTTVVKERVQLADMPAATSLGLTYAGPVLAPNTVVSGVLIYQNADTTVGASGITALDVIMVVTDDPTTKIAALTTQVDLFGSTGAPVTGSPRYLDIDDINVTTISAGPIALPIAGQCAYNLLATGNDLDQLTALDFTLFWLVTPTVLVVP